MKLSLKLYVLFRSGKGGSDVQYEAELERCLELRRNSLESFVKAVRTEIEILWDELMMSEDEKGDFGPFIDGMSAGICLSPADTV